MVLLSKPNSPGAVALRRAAIAACLLLFVSPRLGNCSESEASRSEYQVKAAFLLNFLRFMEWKKDASAPLVLGIIGRDPFGSQLDQISAGKVVNGHTVVVNRLRTPEQARGAHLLFINERDPKKLEALFKVLE